MDISHGTVLPDENPVYRLAGVSKIYRKGGTEIPAVRDLDLEIRAGEWLAVQGKTGHGKTTCCNCSAAWTVRREENSSSAATTWPLRQRLKSGRGGPLRSALSSRPST